MSLLSPANARAGTPSRQPARGRRYSAALLCQGEDGDEENAKGDRLGQFVPTEATDLEWCGFLDEVEPSSKQKRRERDRRDARQQAGKARDCENDSHDQLPGREGP